MVKDFEKSLFNLKSSSAVVSDVHSYPEPGIAGVEVLFSEGSRLRAAYWRVITKREATRQQF